MRLASAITSGSGHIASVNSSIKRPGRTYLQLKLFRLQVDTLNVQWQLSHNCQYHRSRVRSSLGFVNGANNPTTSTQVQVCKSSVPIYVEIGTCKRYFFFWFMIADLQRFRADETRCIFFSEFFESTSTHCKRNFDSIISFCFGRLHTPATCSPMGSDAFQVDCSSDNLNVIQRKLRSLRNYLSIHGYHGTPVVVETIAVASLLVSIQIDPANLVKSLVSYNQIVV